MVIENSIEAALIVLCQEDVVRAEALDLFLQTPVEADTAARKLRILQQLRAVRRRGQEVLVRPQQIGVADDQVRLDLLAALEHDTVGALPVARLRNLRDGRVVPEGGTVLVNGDALEALNDLVVSADRVPNALRELGVLK